MPGRIESIGVYRSDSFDGCEVVTSAAGPKLRRWFIVNLWGREHSVSQCPNGGAKANDYARNSEEVLCSMVHARNCSNSAST